MAKRVFYNNRRDLEGLKYTARVVDFGVGLAVTSSINEMYNAHAFLAAREDLFKGEIKHCCNNAFKEAKRKEFLIKENMRNKQFWLDYSDTVIDEAETDILLFRLSIKQTLDNTRIEDSELISYVETARVMLEMATEQYKCIMDLSQKKFGRDYSNDFTEYYMGKAFFWWGKMCDIVYKGKKVDLNNTNTTGMFDRMCKKFAEGEYIQACVEKAQENNPDFKENKINVIE